MGVIYIRESHVKPFTDEEMKAMAKQFLDTLPFSYLTEDIESFAAYMSGKTQAVVMNHLIESVANTVILGGEEVKLCGETN